MSLIALYYVCSVELQNFPSEIIVFNFTLAIFRAISLLEKY